MSAFIWEAPDILYKPLLPCPFCGDPAMTKSYDRGITIGCPACGYDRHFPGLLQLTINDKPIPYLKKDGTTGLADNPKNQEYYWHDAYDKACDAWNIRASVHVGAAE